jgi:menaquinone-dependent protoporphyrinogen oxidase
MARILVLYGTTDGHTARVAASVAATLELSGVEADLVEAGTRDPDPLAYDGIIVAASVHASGYQRAVKRWVRQHAEGLRGKPTAFLSVSLGVLQQDPNVQQHVAAIVDKFLRTTHWQPSIVENVAGALRYTRYNVVKRWIMKEIARRAGGGTDTSRDYEYTDWDALRAFAGRFGEQVSPASPKRAARAEVEDLTQTLHLTTQ